MKLPSSALDPLSSPVAPDWSQLRHGTIRDFIKARVDAMPGSSIEDNLEHFQAFAVELAGLVRQLVLDPENGFSQWSQRLLPVLKKQTRRGIDKYATALKRWQESVLTFEELEIFVSATFVWKA
jgi:hypothetical protein